MPTFLNEDDIKESLMISQPTKPNTRDDAEKEDMVLKSEKEAKQILMSTLVNFRVELFCVNYLINFSLESIEEFICMEFRFTLRDNAMRAAFQLLHMVLENSAKQHAYLKRSKSAQFSISSKSHSAKGPYADIATENSAWYKLADYRAAFQRVLEHCSDPMTQSKVMVENFGICWHVGTRSIWQHVLEHGKPHERSTIIKKLAGKIVQMSQQKFASNIVEKCLAFGDPNERQLLVDEMLCRIRSLCLRETHLVDNSLYKFSRSSLKMLNVSDTKFALGNKLSQVHGNSLGGENEAANDEHIEDC
ncbi:hypothetical protein T459_23583 [Capsicum annuum]|uniref:Uncharacterized protein n=1 Tax=Capsicum annuum TaxID=4072 RepID=A0A2G2YSQ4_CAPAN|nr:hypothetical protein T459_23583 [Capsicum annuum]